MNERGLPGYALDGLAAMPGAVCQIGVAELDRYVPFGGAARDGVISRIYWGSYGRLWG